MHFMKLMVESHKIGRLVRGFNLSFTVLLPKKKKTLEMTDYRIISLIGGAYRFYPSCWLTKCKIP